MAYALPSFAAVLALALGASTSRAQVFVVDAAGGPGAHFTSLPAAVAAVPSGSVLRVRAGTYAPFALAQKSLVVIGDDASSVSIALSSELVIGPTSASHVVRLRHLTLRGAPFFVSSGMRLASAQGPVLLEDVHLVAATGSNLFAPESLSIDDCPNVHLLACRLLADPQPTGGGSATPHVTCTRSRVELTGSRVEGHRGAPGSLGVGSPGGAGVLLVDSALVLVDTIVLGGRGGPGYDLYPFHGGGPGGRGGAAIELRGASSLELWGGPHQVVRGGDGGAPSPVVYPGADGGDGIVVGARAVVLGLTPQGGAPGDAQHVAGEAFRFSGGTLLHDPFHSGPRASIVGVPTLGATVSFELDAPPGDLAVLWLGFDSLHLELGPTVLGDLFTLPVGATPVQLVPAGGHLAIPLFVSDLLPPGLALYGQFLTLRIPTGELRLSNLVLAPE